MIRMYNIDLTEDLRFFRIEPQNNYLYLNIYKASKPLFYLLQTHRVMFLSFHLISNPIGLITTTHKAFFTELISVFDPKTNHNRKILYTHFIFYQFYFVIGTRDMVFLVICKGNIYYKTCVH